MNRFVRKWKKDNNPDSIPKQLFDPKCVTVGKNSYGELNVTSFNNISRLYIGNYVSIAQGVTFLLDVEHYINHVSTYPFKKKILKGEDEAFSKGDISVGDDVWIGYGATVLSGVNIGQGAVIAAESVVTKDIPPYAIVGGIPAKVIKYRFSDEIIEFFSTLDYKNLTDQLIQEHINELYLDVNQMGLEKIKELYSWFPKKQL